MVIVYFSGTGNSKYIAEKFADRMQIEAHSIEENIDFGQIFDKVDTIAVCYPIYGSCVPLIMREFVKKNMQFFERKKLIIFCTQMLFSGDGAKAFARLIPNCDGRVRYAEHFKMPNNICNFALFPMTEKEKTKKPLRALEKLDKVCSDIQKGVVKKRGWNAFSNILGKTQNIWCGLCVNKCPMHNLELVNGKVKQNGNCTLCYRCVNICPKQSCTVYFTKKPKKQYKGIS